jgi:hypothetical protein
VRDLAVTGDWSRVERTAQTEMRATGDDLPESVLPQLQGHTLATETLEDGMTFAYSRLRWDPAPVLQSYSAYTSYLDHLDATFLSSPRAPQRILYQPVTINNRDPWWEPPATVEAMYCHYREVGPIGHWLLLARVAGPGRCGAPVVIGRATARFGQPVRVPAAPGKMVVATFSLTEPLSSRAEAVALKGPEVDVKVWYGTKAAKDPMTYRFIPGTATDVHVLAVPASLGYPPGYTAPEVRKVELTGGGWAPGQGSVHITFYSVSLATR